jgi:propionyl-CoA synthetase
MEKTRDFHYRSIHERDAFWRKEAERIHWETPFEEVLDFTRPPFAKWFVGGRTNLCYNAVDRWLPQQADAPALIWVSTEVDQERVYTRRALYEEVNAVAAMLREQGVERGDRVLLYMPMVPEAVFTMLACARLGAIHSVVFGGFASVNLAQRIDDAQPKVVVCTDGGSRAGKVVAYKPLLDKALSLAQHPDEVNHGGRLECGGGRCGPAGQYPGPLEGAQYFNHAPHQRARSLAPKKDLAAALGHAAGHPADRFPGA